jgi:hypothetical protein
MNRRLTTTCTGAAEARFTWLFVVPLGGPVMSSVRPLDVALDYASAIGIYIG